MIRETFGTIVAIYAKTTLICGRIERMFDLIKKTFRRIDGTFGKTLGILEPTRPSIAATKEMERRPKLWPLTGEISDLIGLISAPIAETYGLTGLI